MSPCFPSTSFRVETIDQPTGGVSVHSVFLVVPVHNSLTSNRSMTQVGPRTTKTPWQMCILSDPQRVLNKRVTSIGQNVSHTR